MAYNLQYANGKHYKTENSLANFLSTLNPEESSEFQKTKYGSTISRDGLSTPPSNDSPQEGASGAVRPRERPHRHPLGSSSAQAQAQVKNPEFRRVSVKARCHWWSVMVTLRRRPRSRPAPASYLRPPAAVSGENNFISSQSVSHFSFPLCLSVEHF